MVSTIPTYLVFQKFFYLHFSFLSLLWINYFKNVERSITSTKNNKKILMINCHVDILVAARDEENVIERLVERLLNLDYPNNKLNIYIIDDGRLIRHL